MSRKVFTVLFTLIIALLASPLSALAAPAKPSSLLSVGSDPFDSGFDVDFSADTAGNVSADSYVKLVGVIGTDGRLTVEGQSGTLVDALAAGLGYTTHFGSLVVDGRVRGFAAASDLQWVAVSVRGNDILIRENGVPVGTMYMDGLVDVNWRAELAGISTRGSTLLAVTAIDLAQQMGLVNIDVAFVFEGYDGSVPLTWPPRVAETEAAAQPPVAATPKTFSVTVLAGEGTNMVLNRLVRDGVDRGCANDAIELYRMTNDAWDPGTEVPIPAACVPQALGGTLAPSAVPTQLGQ